MLACGWPERRPWKVPTTSFQFRKLIFRSAIVNKVQQPQFLRRGADLVISHAQSISLHVLFMCTLHYSSIHDHSCL